MIRSPGEELVRFFGLCGIRRDFCVSESPILVNFTIPHSTRRRRQQIDSGMIGAETDSQQSQRHVLGILCGMSAGVLVRIEQCSVGQFDVVAIAKTVVDQKPITFGCVDASNV